MQPRFSQSFLIVLSMLLSLPSAAVLASDATSYSSTSIPAAADTSIAELRMQLKALQARLDSLEQQAEPTRNTVKALVASADKKLTSKAICATGMKHFLLMKNRHDTVTGFVHDCRQPKRSKRT